MSLLGQAAIAMWWDIAPDVREDFEHWHVHEHFPERLGIPGFLRGTRWGSASGGEGVFVMYELEAYETLSSAAYLQRLNEPSSWSTRLMPHHRNMVRSQCRVLESRGGGVARHALTLRLSPKPKKDEALRQALRRTIDELAVRPGVVGAHLLRHEAPAIAPTTEQVIRGSSDKAADWVLVVMAYDLAALEQVSATKISGDTLIDLGATSDQVRGMFTLACSATPGDVA